MYNNDIFLYDNLLPAFCCAENDTLYKRAEESWYEKKSTSGRGCDDIGDVDKHTLYYREIAERVNKVWRSVAREKQLPPDGKWRIWLLLAGRGFGKTRAAAELIRYWALSGRCKRLALIGQSIEEAECVMVFGKSGILSLSGVEEGVRYSSTQNALIWDNGAKATLYGANRPEKLRGPEFDGAWVDEIAKCPYCDSLFDQLMLSMRIGKDPRVVMTTTPRPIQFLHDLLARDDVVMTRGSSFENAENLSEGFLKQLSYLQGTRFEAQELYAEIVDTSELGVWSWDDVERCRKNAPPFLKDIVIAIDPAMSCGENSDETGIVIAGVDVEGYIYILEDLSCREDFSVWSELVRDAYERYNASTVVIENNAGGDMWLHMFRGVDPNIKLALRRAHCSKLERASRVWTYYKKGQVFHAKALYALEQQMVSAITPKSSPDRLDALVWAVDFLTNPSGSCDKASFFAGYI